MFAAVANKLSAQSPVMLNQRMKYWLAQLAHAPVDSVIRVFGSMSKMLLLLVLPLLLSCCVDAVGYSYTRFVGPVAGPENKIYVYDDNANNNGKPQHHDSGALRLDYVAKPEYNFAYGVEDADAHILHNRNEMRDGDTVKGVYSLVDPDGTLRVVKYTADEVNGFQAEIIRNGITSLHNQLQHDYMRAPPLKTIGYNHNKFYKPHPEQQRYPQTETNSKGDRNTYYQSSNSHVSAPHVEQLPHLIHDKYNLNNQYQTPPQPPIIYHYNKNYDDDDDDDDDDNDDDDDDDDDEDNDSKDGHNYNEDQLPQYEVHEKLNNDNQNNDHKSKNGMNDGGHRYEKHHANVDDEDYDDESASHELEDYDETVHHQQQSSEESDEYY